MISVCIPVYNSEKYLLKCLESLANQTFKDFEVIVIDDCSSGTNESGWNCKKICKVFSKQTKFKVHYYRNSRNLGCLESRRNATYQAKGDYVFFLDSDDSLKPECLEKLYKCAEQNQADLVQCGATIAVSESYSGAFLEPLQEKVNLLFEGTLQGEQIFNSANLEHKMNFFVWGKLIKRDILLSVWDNIPFCYCVWAEDYLIFLLISFFAEHYAGIKDELYIYSAETGISAVNKIDSLESWEKFCSTASAFTIVFEFLNNYENKITSEQKDAVQRQCNTYALTSYQKIKKSVSDELQEQAYSLLCEYWGKDYIENIVQSASKAIN